MSTAETTQGAGQSKARRTCTICTISTTAVSLLLFSYAAISTQEWTHSNPGPVYSVARSPSTLLDGLMPFVTNRNGCHIEVSEDLTTDHSKLRCSPRIFRRYFAQYGRFYGNGKWRDGDNIHNAVFEPEDCAFSSRLQRGSIRDYLQRRNITYLLVSGDSNGYKFAQSVIALIKKDFRTCKKTREESQRSQGNFDKTYFALPNFPMSILQTSDRGCKFCKAHVYQCVHGNFTIKLEYISLSHFIESSVRVEHTGKFDIRHISANTLLEFLVKYYFKHWGYPDLWAIYAPIMHELWHRDLSTFDMYAHNFRHFLNAHLPRSSRLIVLPTHRECPVFWPQKMKDIVMKNKVFKTSVNEKLHNMNQILFNALKSDLLDPKGNVLGFLDLAEVSCPVACKWHDGGAHMQVPWYNKMATYMFQFLANEN